MIGSRIAVLIPFYNGLETIRQLVDGCVRVLNDLDSKYRIIVVDDSNDQGKHVGLQSELSGIPRVEIVKLSLNYGQHVATFLGLLNTLNEDVITIDEDLQFNPIEISRLISEARNSNREVVYGHFNRTGVNGLCRGASIGAVKPLLANNYPKFTSSFRLMDKELVDMLKKQRPILIQMEGLILHNANDFGYVELAPVDQPKETKSGYSILSLFWMITGLINHYSMVPFSLVSLLLVICDVALLINENPLGVMLMPFSIVGLLALLGEFKTRRTRSAVLKEIENQKRLD